MKSILAAAALALVTGAAAAQVVIPPRQAEPATAPGQQSAPGVTLDPKASEYQIRTAQLQYQRALEEKTPLDVVRQNDARRQWYLNFALQALLTVAGLILLLCLLPRIASISLPAMGGVLQISTMQPTPPPLIPGPTMLPPAVVPAQTMKFDDQMAKALVKHKEHEMATLETADIAPEAIQLRHTVLRTRQGPVVEVSLQSSDVVLAKIIKVLYQPHPSMSVASVTSTDRASKFVVRFTTDAEFMLYALVYIGSDDAHPIRLKRYINLR
ncbi:MAG TPA: hypothetical protein VJ901_09010 [Thermoanaerobaculia bacterium]|nr:hypothetical protein [Thermoanaerobaculia bacterium]